MLRACPYLLEDALVTLFKYVLYFYLIIRSYFHYIERNQSYILPILKMLFLPLPTLDFLALVPQLLPCRPALARTKIRSLKWLIFFGIDITNIDITNSDWLCTNDYRFHRFLER